MPDITVQTSQTPVIIQPTRITVTAATVGLQGPPGPQGLPGSTIANLGDVLVINPQTNQFLKYVNGLWTNVNSENIDGGNF